MNVPRIHLTTVCNALYATGTTSIPVSHPSKHIGELIRIELGDPQESSVYVTLDADAYAAARSDVDRTFGTPAVTELPSRQSYLNAFLAGGLLEAKNADEIEAFLDQNGYPDLSAGHQPVVAGFDTNLLPWGLANVWNLEPGETEVVSGFLVTTGIRDELDWDQKRTNTDPLVQAFGPTFEAFWNQPAGSRREGRLGELFYRQLRDHRYADEIPSDRSDEGILSAVEEYQAETRKVVLLFSNDRDFIERANAHRIRAQRVVFPDLLPRRIEGNWEEMQRTLYFLTILFGVLELPKITLYGVWRGKGGQDWHEERLKCECRSPKIADILERDFRILEAGKGLER